jgi:hypothetical protein
MEHSANDSLLTLILLHFLTRIHRILKEQVYFLAIAKIFLHVDILSK